MFLKYSPIMVPHDCELHGEQMHIVQFTHYDPKTRLIHFTITCEHCPGMSHVGNASPMDWMRLLVQLSESDDDCAN